MLDKKRIPICLGDLLKVTKINEQGKKEYEYQLVGERNEKSFGVVYRFLMLDLAGTYLDIQDDGQIFDNIEIVQGYGDGVNVIPYKDRKKVKVC